MRKLSYKATLDFLYSQLPMYQRIGAAAFKKDLTNITELCQALGNPQDQYPVIHVAGTNGKGSTCFMLSAILQSAGLKTGLSISPHYRDFRERARINGAYIPKSFIIDFVARLRPVLETLQPSFFEMSTALSFDYFAAEGVDVAVIETGLGGRLDSTNIVKPILSVITNIGFDHMEFLGDTLPLIAAEKAGIIKSGTPVVVGEELPETKPVFAEKARMRNAPISVASENWRVIPLKQEANHSIFEVFHGNLQAFEALPVNLSGSFQANNIQTTLEAIEVLKKKFPIGESHIRHGLANLRKLTGFMGRWETIGIRPSVICDSAHNPQGLEQVLRQLREMPRKHLHIVFGMVKDKNPEAVLSLLPQEATYYFCKANIPRGLEANLLMEKSMAFNLKGKAYSSVKKALQSAKQRANPEDIILVTGSIFVVAEVL
jgi:dihydrofolate synthase/folylpolyglutamate synthase